MLMFASSKILLTLCVITSALKASETTTYSGGKLLDSIVKGFLQVEEMNQNRDSNQGVKDGFSGLLTGALQNITSSPTGQAFALNLAGSYLKDLVMPHHSKDKNEGNAKQNMFSLHDLLTPNGNSEKTLSSGSGILDTFNEFRKNPLEAVTHHFSTAINVMKGKEGGEDKSIYKSLSVGLLSALNHYTDTEKTLLEHLDSFDIGSLFGKKKAGKAISVRKVMNLVKKAYPNSSLSIMSNSFLSKIKKKGPGKKREPHLYKDQESQEMELVSGNCFCPKTRQPICGNDGKTYANQCAAECDNIQVVHKGECIKNKIIH